jgi:transposase
VSPAAYRLLGFVVWKGGKWYVRQRLPRAGLLARRGLVAGGALTAMLVAARRVRR